MQTGNIFFIILILISRLKHVYIENVRNHKKDTSCYIYVLKVSNGQTFVLKNIKYKSKCTTYLLFSCSTTVFKDVKNTGFQCHYDIIIYKFKIMLLTCVINDFICKKHIVSMIIIIIQHLYSALLMRNTF